jgi:GNAT superfamily N-acetyltransferase
MLVPPGKGVADPLDFASSHVLVWTVDGDLVGYGRVAVIENLKASEFKSIHELDIFHHTAPSRQGDSFAYISRLVVDPAHRRRGIATMIHKARIDVAAKLGATSMFGWAVGENPRTALTAAGFIEVLEKKGFSTSWYRTDRTTRLVKLNLLPEVARRPSSHQEASSY